MSELYAICRSNGAFEVKHVQLSNALQQQVGAIFQAQYADFLKGISAEIDFTGDWKPDADELLVARGLVEAGALLAATAQNAIALPVLDVAHFQAEGVRGLATTIGQGAQQQILIQSFSPQQLLSGRFALLHDGNVFRRITEPAFSIGSQLLATVDAAGDVRFKSFQMLRRVFDLSHFYQQATDADLNAFCAHASLSVADPAAFLTNADESVRKAIHLIAKSNVLGQHTVAEIELQGQSIGFQVAVVNNRIEVPPDKKAAKALFSFLLDRVYLGAMNQQLFITNSHRPL